MKQRRIACLYRRTLDSNKMSRIALFDLIVWMRAVFFKVVVIICLLIKQLLFLDLGERHQQAHSFWYHLASVQGLALLQRVVPPLGASRSLYLFHCDALKASRNSAYCACARCCTSVRRLQPNFDYCRLFKSPLLASLACTLPCGTMTQHTGYHHWLLADYTMK